MRICSGADALLDLALSIAKNPESPKPERLRGIASQAIEALSAELPESRPLSSRGEPGGLVRLSTPYAVIVPDLHARPILLFDLLSSISPHNRKIRIVDAILEGELTLLCLGDVLNSEGKVGARRWMKAAASVEAAPGAAGILSEAMDEEMGASLAALSLVMTLKRELSGGFHCLKGNHDNISNTNREGDSSFFKFALEGAMGAEWFRLRYGDEAMTTIRRYERLLPLAAVGQEICASHAEPAFSISVEDLLEYRERPDIVRALIWTANGEAESGSTQNCLAALLGPETASGRGMWIAGHRPVAGAYALRAGNRLLQIHNPERRQVAWIDNHPTQNGPGIALFEIGRHGGKLRLLETVDPFRLDQ